MTASGRARLLHAALGTLLVALAIFFREIDRLGAQSEPWTRFSILEVTGFGALQHTDQWMLSWTDDPSAWRVRSFIALYLGFDAVFIVAYAIAIWLIIDRLLPGGRRAAARTTLVLLVLADVVEDVLLASAGGFAQTPSGVPWKLAQSLAWASTVKWVLVALLAVVVLRLLAKTRRITAVGRVMARVIGAIFAQRIVAVFVVVLVVLNLIPLHPILEQVPDIMRGWFDPGGWGHGVIAYGVLVFFAVGFWFTGRSIAARDGVASSSRTGWNYLIWAAFPLAVVVGGLVAGRSWEDRRVWLLDPEPHRVFLGLCGGVLAISMLIEAGAWWRARHPDALDGFRAVFAAIHVWFRAARDRARRVLGLPAVESSAGPPPEPDAGPVATAPSDARRAIAVFGALILVLPTLGLVRTLSTQLIVWITAPHSDDPLALDGVISGETAGVSIVSIVAALAVCTLLLWAATGPASVADLGWMDAATPSRSWRVLAVLFASVPIVLIIVIVLWPMSTARSLGAVAVAVAVLGSWLLLIGLLSVVLSFRAPLRLFRAVGLRADPTLTIFVLVPFLVAQFAAVPGVHSVTRSAPPATLERTALPTALDDWLARNDGCTGVVDVDGVQVPIRPLALVAAEGGGIRAAAWTGAALSEFVSAGPCVSNSVFLSSGVSGGAVGLAVAANPGWTDDELISADAEHAAELAERLRDGVRSIGDSGALGAAVEGLVIIDPLTSTTGIRIPSLESAGRWRDRASLIEHSWREAHESLAMPFDGVAAAPTGLVVLNATDIASGCRAVISQVELGPGQSGHTTSDLVRNRAGLLAECGVGTAEPALTFDVNDRFETCGGRIDWATAALLSARFPYVTPSATIGNGRGQCGLPRMQLVDGGYAENSGLGLIADTAPTIARLVQRYNASRRPAGAPLVVPYVVYLQNSPQVPTEPSGLDATAELLVPIAGSGAKGVQVAPSTWIQRAFASLRSLCGPAPAEPSASAADCLAQASALGSYVDAERRTAIVQPMLQPSISVPLGWGLSEASYCQLVRDAHRQTTFRSAHPFEFENAFGNYLELFPDRFASAEAECHG